MDNRSRFHQIRIVLSMLALVGLSACVSLWEDFDRKQLENKEFDQQVEIKEMEAAPADASTGAPVVTAPSTSSVPVKEKKPKTKKTDNAIQVAIEKVQEAAGKIKSDSKSAGKTGNAATAADSNKPQPHLPPIEDSEGFNGRRPIVDPYVVGEELEFAVSYFAVEAGRFTMSIKPYKEVNGKKSYHFSYHARSSSVFSMFYAVDDRAEAYMDYELLVPYSYTIQAKESKQIRDVRNFSDWKNMKAKMWDKKIKKGKEPEIRNLEWDIAPYAQNVFTVAYYLRSFTLRVGKKLAVNVAHDGKNLVMTADVIREEKLNTSIGNIDTFVIKPSFEIDGVFKPVGDVYLWVTKDKYKRVVRLESKIKIGTVVATIEKIKP